MRLMLLASILLSLSGCAKSTRSLPPVRPFDAERYVGTWYEVARFPHRFERGLSAVSANYSLNADGSVRVLNRGYRDSTEEWKAIEGRASFAAGRDTGLLRVTFFRPFSGQYRIIALDQEDYAWAIVTSGTYRYLWILSRTPTLPDPLLESLVDAAREMGFDTDQLIYVDQGRNLPPEH